MEKTKHTPGPWELKAQRNSIDEYDCYLYPQRIYIPDGVSESDANLISAAPELLDAAYKTMEWWEDHKYDTTGDRGEWNLFDSEPVFVTQARAAINKATGA